MTMHNATIEWSTRTADPTTVDELMTALADWHPSVHTGPRGHLAATISLPAETLRQAATTALAIAEDVAPGAPVLTLEVMPTSEHDRRAGLTPVPELISVTQAAARLGVTRQAVLQRLDAGTLPGQRVGTTWAIPVDAIDRASRTDTKEGS